MLDTLPSGPPLPGIIQTVAWGLRPQSFFNACRRRYGPTFTMRFFDGTDIVVLSRPEDIRAVFTLSADQFETGRDNADMLEPFLGPRTVLALDGDEHRDERRRLQHAFRSERLDSYRQIVVDATLAEMATWRVGSQVRLHDATRTIALEVILRAVFGAEEGRELQGLRDALDPFLAESTGSPLVLIPQLRRDLGRRSPWGRFVRQRAAVHREVLALVARRRAEPDVGTRTDMLAALLEGTDDDSLVLDELMTLLLAGHDTTATGLAWTFDLLLHHPAVLTRLRSELASDDGDDRYLDAVIQESLRVRPVVGEVGRRPLGPFTCSAGELPAGTAVMPSIYLAHTDAERYPEPFAFRPERFLDGAPADLATWLPFGGGVRRCLGAAFATLEMREVVRTVVCGADLRADSSVMEKPKRRAVTLMPKEGVRAVVVSVDDDYVRPTRSSTSSGRPISPVTKGPNSA